MKKFKFSNQLQQATTLASAALLCFLQTAHAAEPMVVIESGGVSITTLDLESEILRAPPEVRSGLLFRKDSVAQLASNLLMRRALAKQAEAAGLANTPLNQASIQLVKDRVLSDIQLARLDELNKPTAQALEQRIRDVYKAESKRFEIPEQVQASHILVATGEGAEDKAKAILEDLKAGKDFAELAKEKSADPGSAAKGGDLGMFGRGKMVKPFEEAAFTLKVGEMSGLVQSQFGFHILKVTARQEAGVKPFEEVRDILLKDVSQRYLSEGRMKAGEKIMTGAKPNPDALDAFIASQKPKD